MLTVPQALALAVQQHQAGQLQQAEQIYRAILEVKPQQVEALHLLGLVAYQVGKHELARVYMGRALRLKPDFVEGYINLAAVLQEQGHLAEAQANLQQALRLRPDLAEAHNNLGNVLKEQGQLTEAQACYQQALRLKPDLAEAHNNLGNLLKDQGKLEEARASLEQALRLKPDYAEAHNNLGNVFKEQGHLAKAQASLEQALRLEPVFAEAHNNLGNVLKEQGKLVEARVRLQEALRLKPGFAEAHNSLGNVLREQGQLAEALACYQQALRLEPDYAEAHNNLGAGLQKQGKLEDARVSFERALRLEPVSAEAHNNLGNVLKDQGQLDEALACYQQALRLKPDSAEFHSNLLLALHYRTGVTLKELADAHAAYERQHTARLRSSWRPHPNDCDPQRRLRLGFMSPDLGRHPVGYFLIRVLEHLDPEQADLVCYNNRLLPDDLTRRFQATATTWWDVAGWNDDQLAEQIRADRIDLLFDLAGHTAGNRLGVFACKPAPIQLTWLGYEGTTGLQAIDYLLADRYLIPEKAEAYYHEQVLRLPESYVCYEPPPFAPAVAPLPALASGQVTFGSFNNPAKITAEVIAVWAQVLQQVPQSRLVLKYRGLDDPALARRLRQRFASQGIDPARVECRGRSSHADMLAEYHGVDLALDPFPFTGGVTTCEALWMGVPVLTCPGETFASRHGLSHLSNIGLTETIASSRGEYVALAEALAGDLPRLAGLRARLREAMAGSPLCDGPRLAANLLRLLRSVWQQWLTQGLS